MTREGFVRRLNAGRAVNLVYRREEREGLVSAWRYGTEFVLTWEECPLGCVFDESRYTRDDRHVFTSAEAVLGFVEGHGFQSRDFTP